MVQVLFSIPSHVVSWQMFVVLWFNLHLLLYFCLSSVLFGILFIHPLYFVFGNSFLHPLHFCTLKFFLHLPYFEIRNFLYIYTRYIFEFGNSFLHPLYFCIRIFFFKSTLFLYSEIPFSFLLYFCIREFHFHPLHYCIQKYLYALSIFFIRKFLFTLDFLLFAQHSINILMITAEHWCHYATRAWVLFIYLAKYKQEIKFQKLFSLFVFASVVFRCWNVVWEQILGSTLGNCLV